MRESHATSPSLNKTNKTIGFLRRNQKKSFLGINELIDNSWTVWDPHHQSDSVHDLYFPNVNFPFLSSSIPAYRCKVVYLPSKGPTAVYSNLKLTDKQD